MSEYEQGKWNGVMVHDISIFVEELSIFWLYLTFWTLGNIYWDILVREALLDDFLVGLSDVDSWAGVLDGVEDEVEGREERTSMFLVLAVELLERIEQFKQFRLG